MSIYVDDTNKINDDDSLTVASAKYDIQEKSLFDFGGNNPRVGQLNEKVMGNADIVDIFSVRKESDINNFVPENSRIKSPDAITPDSIDDSYNRLVNSLSERGIKVDVPENGDYQFEGGKIHYVQGSELSLEYDLGDSFNLYASMQDGGTKMDWLDVHISDTDFNKDITNQDTVSFYKHHESGSSSIERRRSDTISITSEHDHIVDGMISDEYLLQYEYGSAKVPPDENVPEQTPPALSPFDRKLEPSPLDRIPEKEVIHKPEEPASKPDDVSLEAAPPKDDDAPPIELEEPASPPEDDLPEVEPQKEDDKDTDKISDEKSSS